MSTRPLAYLLAGVITLLPLTGVIASANDCKGLRGQERARCQSERRHQGTANSATTASQGRSKSSVRSKGKPCNDLHKTLHKKWNDEHKQWHKEHKVGGSGRDEHKQWHKKMGTEHTAFHTTMHHGECALPGGGASTSSTTSAAVSTSSASSVVSSQSSSVSMSSSSVSSS